MFGLRCQCSYQLITTCSIERRHPANMGTVVAGGNEIGECDLQGDRHQQAEMSLRQDKGICQAFGSDQVSDANIGKHRLGESAEIDRAIAGSEANECRDGSPLILKLTVVVVLD